MTIDDPRKGTGYVETVTGPIRPETLSATLMHEHVLCDLTPLERRGEDEAEITLQNIFDVNWRPNDYPGNHRLQDEDVAIREARWFGEAGGGTIVDVTTGGIVPDPEGLARVAQASGVNIVMGAGFYTEPFLDADTLSLSEDALFDIMLGQMVDGENGIRCGVIGEIGCSWPLTPFEARSLAAAARTQVETGAAITVHPGRHRDAPHEILDILERNGADISRVIIDHMDRTLEEPQVLALAQRGCVVEYDFFGIEQSNYWLGILDLPTDWMRIRTLRKLFDAGLGDRVTLSHDICTRGRLQSYGGHGYSHLLRNVVPLMKDRGFAQAEVDQLLVETPRRLLTLQG
ncbi:phosphotriesterase family protein [Martelella radicis]|uniref:Phosphotriesterase-related protein n=1 Tax=Martelella radicis TaxID=1397476 RepID=A0A7W6PBC5_9HYPH|nr:aryldialkylphosphatase [Martelella radicis]MBB4123341.1 phosphotriesterase-related protein [Martelella radicis]